MEIFENRKCRGAVSIFLVIITIPTLLFSAVLIDGSRMSSAKAITQEAADLAASSTLAKYNQKLKDDFGLLAFDDSSKLEEIYKTSLNATLLASGLSTDSEYSERIWSIMKTALTGNKSYDGESFLNLYDFSVDSCSVEPLYPLAEKEVLENQMVEYSKFRGIYVMTDRMGIFSSLGDLQDEAEDNETASEVMEDKMETDEDNGDADEALYNLKCGIDEYDNAIEEMKQAEAVYFEDLAAWMEEVRIENIDTEEELSDADAKAAENYSASKDSLEDAMENACDKAVDVLSLAKTAKTEVEKAVSRLEDFRSENEGTASGNETAQSLIDDAEDGISSYEAYLPAIREIIHDDNLTGITIQRSDVLKGLTGKMEDIDDAVTAYIEEIEETRESMSDDGDDEDGDDDDDEITEYYYYLIVHRLGRTQDINEAINGGDGVQYYRPAIDASMKIFSHTWTSESVDPAKKNEGTSSDAIDEDFAKSESGTSGDSDSDSDGATERSEVEESVYKARPSSTYTSESGTDSNTSFYNTSGDLSASKSILNQGKHSMIQDIAETTRDDVLCLTYMFGTFKTRLTGVSKFTSGGMSQSDKDSFYMPEWRYAHENGEVDMRFSPKKDRTTVLRGEIEYLIYGNRTDKANESAVYATIFAERLANNVIAMYMEKKTVNPSCHAAAAAASVATLGIVPETVFFWIFITAWATAETVIEMNYLISDGYKIPLIKTKDNILLRVSPSVDTDGLISNYGESGFFVTYEDYLLILLLIKGREKRIMRTADLIEMNMKKNSSSDFTMAKAYTYLHVDTEMSIRYLFGSVYPFESYYSDAGYTGRMKYTNTIYLGY